MKASRFRGLTKRRKSTAELRLARQHSRAAQRHRAGGPSRPGPVVVLANLPSQIGNPRRAEPDTFAKPQAAGEPLTLEQMEADYIRRVLTSAASIGEAATMLGIDPSTLYRKRKRYGI